MAQNGSSKQTSKQTRVARSYKPSDCAARPLAFAFAFAFPLAVGGGEGDKEGEKKGKEAKKSGGKTSDVASLPRKMFAEKLDEIWSDLGSSEIRQGMLVKPSDYHLVAIGGMVKTQEVICTHCCRSALSSMQPEGWQVGCRLSAADFGQGLTWRMWTAPSPV